MEDIRKLIGKNLADLRKRKGLTQLELAEKFNYTDRAVSKWENGDTLPDVVVLYELCEFYGVTLDYLTHEDNAEYVKDEKLSLSNQIVITALVSSVFWTLATIIFVFSIIRHNHPLWQSFIWAVPLNCLILLYFNHIYFHRRFFVFLFWSIFIWGFLTGAYLSILHAELWPLFLLGIPAQATMLIWLNLHLPKKNKKTDK